MKKIIIFIPVVILSLGLNAQVAGYQGKRFMVGYTNYLNPSSSGFNARHNTGWTYFNFRHCIDVEYIFSDHSSAISSLQFYKTSSAGVYISSVDQYGLVDISGFNFELGFKKYNNQLLAPLGTYFQVSGLILFLSSNYDHTIFRDSHGNMVDFNPEKNNLTTFGIAYTFGSSFVFFDKIIFDYGLQMCFVPGLYDEISDDAIADNFEDYNNVLLKTRVSSMHAISLRLRVGYLAF